MRYLWIWHFLDKGFEFQVDVCNGYHDILMMSLILTDVANLHIHGADYYCIISVIRRNEAIKVIWNNYLVEKTSINKCKNFLSYVKLGKENLTFNYIEVALTAIKVSF